MQTGRFLVKALSMKFKFSETIPKLGEGSPIVFQSAEEGVFRALINLAANGSFDMVCESIGDQGTGKPVGRPGIHEK